MSYVFPLVKYVNFMLWFSQLGVVVSLTLLCKFQASYPQSLISEMFGGFLRSSVHQAGLKDSANVEPFFELQLDVQVCNLRLISEGLNGVLDLTAHGSNFDHSTANG